MGNYLSFGDSKFVPRCSKEEFGAVILATGDETAKELWDKCADKMFSLEANERELGLPPKGISTYYSDNITQADIDLVQDYMNEKSISPYNTRLWKIDDNTYELRYAAVNPISGEVRARVHST